jgi:hypothetical protein
MRELGGWRDLLLGTVLVAAVATIGAILFF